MWNNTPSRNSDRRSTYPRKLRGRAFEPLYTLLRSGQQLSKSHRPWALSLLCCTLPFPLWCFPFFNYFKEILITFLPRLCFPKIQNDVAIRNLNKYVKVKMLFTFPFFIITFWLRRVGVHSNHRTETKFWRLLTHPKKVVLFNFH